MKQWAGSNDVKDKNPLLEARRTIEREMERFKVVEKETKTKAFSKEGLARAASSKDPKEKAREDARDWLNRATDGLNEQTEAFEAEARSRYTRRFPRYRVRASRTPILNKDFLSRRSSLSAHTTVSPPKDTPRRLSTTTPTDASRLHPDDATRCFVWAFYLTLNPKP